MREQPLALSARLIDTGVVDTPPNRITQELSELGDGVALVESFSHVLVVDTGDGLVAFDTSGPQSGTDVVAAIRQWSTDRVDTIVYTHGHLDHVGGSPAFAADAVDRNQPAPRVIGNCRILDRFERYARTSGYNRLVNLRQVGGAARVVAQMAGIPFLPAGTLRPDVVYEDRLTDRVGDVEFELHACKGETDDHTWTWIPSQRIISAGDQFIWNFPNCGNPQKGFGLAACGARDRTVGPRRASTRMSADRVRGGGRAGVAPRARGPFVCLHRAARGRDVADGQGLFQSAVADSQTIVTGEPPPFNLVLAIGE